MPTREAEFSADDLRNLLPPENLIFGSSIAQQDLRQAAEKIANSLTPTLITGETGTGKEVLAKHIHLQSPWRDAPYLKFNCPILHGALPRNDPLGDVLISISAPLIAQAAEARLGSARGTLLLNEIALLDPVLQLSLLDRLRESPLVRLELPEGKSLELRIICATASALEQEVREGHFLPELYDLISAVTLALPPLRRRQEDIPQLSSYFLYYYNRKFQTRAPPPSRKVVNMMVEHHWPGNIRELENLIMRYVVQGSEEAFSGELGGRGLSPPTGGLPPRSGVQLKSMAWEVGRQLERKIIRKVLEEYHGNRKQTARALNISYRSLLYKIKEVGVPPKRHVPGRSRSAAHPGGPKSLGSGHREEALA